MRGCIEHNGVITFGCEACNATFRGHQVDAEAASDLMDRAYAKGFEDGAKWMATGARAQLDAVLRSLAKGVRRTEIIATARESAAAFRAAQHKSKEP